MKLDAKNLGNDLVRLEPLTADHKPLLENSSAVDSMWDWMPMIEGGIGFENYFTSIQKQRKLGLVVPFVVLCRPDDTFAGVAAFINPNRTHRRVRIGYVWHPETVRGRGIFRATQLAMLVRAFDDWGARRVEWIVDMRNTAAQRAVDGLGAHKDGVMQEWQRLSDGTWSDVVLFSMLRSAWPAKRAALEEMVAGASA
jgi:N-acetyltransferase